MKFIHLADLHLGKAIHGISLIESGDQPVWVERFLALSEELRPDAVLIAGDVYDRGAPSGDAVQLLDRLLTGLAELEIPVLLIAGNHDSGQRLSFAGSILARERVHIAGILPKGGRLERVTLRDEHGPVHFWLMPYIFPALAADALGDAGIRDYDTAVRAVLSAQELCPGERNVLLAHQNVTLSGEEAPRGGSESMVGGLGQVDWRAFDGFDYVALGHIHAAYAVGRESLRFAGSPLCYHFNETRQPVKGPVLVELGAPGEAPRIRTLQIPPLHPMRELRGSYEELREQELQERRTGEYLRIVLTDRRTSPEIADFFRSLAQARGSRVLELVSEYRPFAETGATAEAKAVEEKSVQELFADFYAERCGAEPGAEDLRLLEFAAEQLGRSQERSARQRAIDALLDFALGQEDEP